MARLFGGFSELPLREAVAGADRGTVQRATLDLLNEVQLLRGKLRSLSRRVPWDQDKLCWCRVQPFDDGSTRTWGGTTTNAPRSTRRSMKTERAMEGK